MFMHLIFLGKAATFCSELGTKVFHKLDEIGNIGMYHEIDGDRFFYILV